MLSSFFFKIWISGDARKRSLGSFYLIIIFKLHLCVCGVCAMAFTLGGVLEQCEDVCSLLPPRELQRLNWDYQAWQQCLYPLGHLGGTCFGVPAV